MRAVKTTLAALLCLLLTLALYCPATAEPADGGQKVVRVGWFEPVFNQADHAGRRTGYGYEYQLKLAAYTGWKYEYVQGSWPNLLKMLEDGEIDLLSDVAYTDERAGAMLFPSLPMGTEEFYIFITPDNREITPEDYASFAGRTIGVMEGSVAAGFYREWAAQHAVDAELVELTCTEDAAVGMLESGALDAYITQDAFTEPKRLVPVCKLGVSDFFFAVNRARPDLLSELNAAMLRVQDENRYYNLQMFEKYRVNAGTDAFLTAAEAEWIDAHGPIRVGYQDGYLAFCAADAETGELTGALADFLENASASLANARLAFDAKAYRTAEAALQALERGEVDCVFPANLSSCDGEALDLSLTPPLMETAVYAVVRQSEKNLFARREHMIVAVNEGNPNYDSFLLDEFPDWVRVVYPTTEQCLKAVADGVADCVLISSYRYNNISRLCDRYHLGVFATGRDLNYSFALQSGDTRLYSILAKVIGQVPGAVNNASLAYYAAMDARPTLGDLIRDHLSAVLAALFAVLLAILILLVRSLRAEKLSRALISATETDDMTGLYNRDFFFQYANSMVREHPEQPMDAIVINIEQFHTLNALNGRDFGDRILRALGSEISAVARETQGIAGRFGADRFDIFCRHPQDCQAIFDRLQAKVGAMAPNASVRLRMGVMPWAEGLEPVAQFDRARTACSMARGHYKEHLIVFDDAVRERELYEQRLSNDLRRALDNYEFEIHYQPKYAIQSDPPALVSAEALIRWRHPELGMIPPNDFIPLFERNGQIMAVDRYVWSTAARQIVRWREQYGVTIPVSVNLSRVDVFDPTLEKTLEDILAFNGLGPGDLKLEVTESAYTDNSEQVIRVVENLRAKGFQVEMDDFGTGYSSLNMLSDMPIDVLKMDRAFIRNLEENEKDVQLVALILGIAKNLRIPVVAEGVETESQLKLLRQLGCSVVQGYYFSRPLHPADFEAAIIQNMPECR